ncbi:hypothetical protein BDV26DRAFT_262101 [Aspergillus bertholletiae]|uniref:Uncharacterized protein n=1 Tax=Aspergillus bertholletiae TaxID=1226010 RepID=A0A5N7B8Q0_9EURO|nr:hypothetical protein BDV26DRAFT_262101 [Aspergillus bertholletiae]
MFVLVLFLARSAYLSQGLWNVGQFGCGLASYPRSGLETGQQQAQRSLYDSTVLTAMQAVIAASTLPFLRPSVPYLRPGGAWSVYSRLASR